MTSGGYSDWEAVKRVCDNIAYEFARPKHKRPILTLLKEQHPELYSSLISGTDGHLSIRHTLAEFARDESKFSTLPLLPERLQAVRQALPLVEPIIQRQTRKIGWGLGIAGAATLVGALFINHHGKSDDRALPTAASYSPSANGLTPDAPKKDTWQEKWAKALTYLGIHTGYCTATDFLNPPINTLTDGYLRWLIPGCGHVHTGGGHAHDIYHEGCHHAPVGNRWQRTTQALKDSFSWKRFKDYCKGEFIGDFGAIPATMVETKLFPHFVTGLRKLCEPVMGPIFRWSASRDSKNWAKQQHLAPDAPEVKEHANKLYQYELEHLPEAVMWTGNAWALNTAYQMHADKSKIPFPNKLLLKGTSALTGVGITAAVVMLARACLPDQTHRAEEWVTKKVTLPLAMAGGKLAGIDQQTMVDAAKEHIDHQGGAWTAKVPLPKRKTEARDTIPMTEHWAEGIKSQPAGLRSLSAA